MFWSASVAVTCLFYTGRMQMGAELSPGHGRVTERSPVNDAVALRDGLAGLAAIGSGSLPLPDLLDRVTMLAARATPAADGVGIVLTGMRQAGRPVRACAASTDFVSQIEVLQHPSHEARESGGSRAGSPSDTAAAEGRTIRTGSVGDDPRWPAFGSEVSRFGVKSVLSLPLLIGEDEVIGVIDAYAREPKAFDERAAAHGESFAAAAAVVVHNADALDQARLRAAQLETALVNRSIIDQAIGVLRSRSGSSAKECFERLRAASRAENLKIAVVAERVVREAVRRARACGPDA